MDVDARIQLFDLKTKYGFQTVPGVDQYNMPLYSIQPDPSANNTLQSPIASFPVYQGFMSPCFVGGVPVSFSTSRSEFFNSWSPFLQNSLVVGQGDGGSNYDLQIPFISNNPPIVNAQPSGLLRGHVDINGVISANSTVQDPIFATTLNLNVPTTSVYSAIYFTTVDQYNNTMIVQDSGQFLLESGAKRNDYGLLMIPGEAPFGNQALVGGYSTILNTINYQTGSANVTFSTAVPSGQNINAQFYFFSPGLPRAILYFNNIITLRSVPNTQYLVELDAYLSPAAFLSTASALPFGYMAEYIARGAARKILSDTGDVEQFQFYEPLFREQEILVWKRSQRQNTATRVPTIYSHGPSYGNGYGLGSQGIGNL